LQTESDELLLLAWDGDDCWTFSLDVGRSPSPGGYVVSGCFRRGAERMDVSTPVLMFGSGFLCTRDRVASFDDRGAFAWLVELTGHGPFEVPRSDGVPLTAAILGLPRVPSLDVAPELAFEEVRVVPQPQLRLRPGPTAWGPNRLRGTLS